MDNDKLLEKVKEEFKIHTGAIAKKAEGEFKRHMDILSDQHKREIQIVGEGHNTLLRKLDEFRTEFHEHKETTEKGIDRLTLRTMEIKSVVKDYEKRISKVEEKIGI